MKATIDKSAIVDAEFYLMSPRPEDAAQVQASIGQLKGRWVNLIDRPSWANNRSTAVFQYHDDLIPASIAFAILHAMSNLPLSECDLLEYEGGGVIRLWFEF